MKGHVRTLLLVALAALCSRFCYADSIKIGDRTLDDVYITENADYYFVRIPSDGSLETVSKKRTDVRDVNRSSDPEARKRLLQQWQKAIAPEETHARAQAEAAHTVAQEGARARAQAKAAQKEAAQEEALRKGRIDWQNEEARRRAQAEAAQAQAEARAKLPSCVREYIDSSQGRPMCFYQDNWDLKVGRIGYIRAKIIQIIDDSSLLLELYSRPLMVIVKGVTTSGLVDDKLWPGYTKMLQVTGIVQYVTVLGSTKTVFVLEPFDVGPFRDAIPASMLLG